MVYEYVAAITTVLLVITYAVSYKWIMLGMKLTLNKKAKIVPVYKSNKNWSLNVVVPDGNSLKGVTDSKDGVKIDAQSIFMDEMTGRHVITIDESQKTSINPVSNKKDDSKVDAKLIEQMNREAAEIALLERQGREDQIMKWMTYVVIGLGITVLASVGTAYLVNGNADMITLLLAR